MYVGRDWSVVGVFGGERMCIFVFCFVWLEDGRGGVWSVIKLHMCVCVFFFFFFAVEVRKL